ncbi:MAG: hypothetical protein ACM3PQ_00050 [Methanosarcina sp.]
MLKICNGARHGCALFFSCGDGMQQRLTNRAVSVLAVMLLSLLLAACGGGSNVTGSTNDSTSGSTGSSNPATGGASTPGPTGGGTDGSNPASANNAVATIDPAGTITATVGAAQVAHVTFTSSNDKPLTNLTVTSDLTSLPAGWNGVGSFSCTTVTTDGACRLDLVYVPDTAPAAGTLTLNYQYTDSAGASRAASVAIAYEATSVPSNAFILNNGDRSVTRCTIGGNGIVSGCASVATGLPDQPTSLAISGTTAYVTSNSLGTLTKCAISSDGTFSSCADAGVPAMGGPRSMVVANSTLYIAEFSGRKVTKCTINADGSLTGCTDSGVSFVNNVFSIAINGGYLYAAIVGSTIYRCNLANDGSLSSCISTGTAPINGAAGMTISGSTLYVVDNWDDVIYQCAIGSDGSLSGCAAGQVSAGGMKSPVGISIIGTYAYVANDSGSTVTLCQVASDGSLTACKDSGATMLNRPISIAFKKWVRNL